MERLRQLARRRDNRDGKKKNIDKEQTNDDPVACGESSIEVNHIVSLHHLSDAAMKQAASKESGDGDDELDNSSQTSLGLEDLVDQRTGPQSPTDKNTRRHDSFVRLGHTSDISVAISLATEYSGRRERNSLQLSSKPWKAVTEQPHQRRQRNERSSLNRSMSVSSLEARRQTLRKEYGARKSLSSCSHADILSDKTRSASSRRRRRVSGRSSSSIVSSGSGAGGLNISSSRGGSGRRRRQTSSTSLNSTSSSRSPHKERNDILSPKVKNDEVRPRRQKGGVDRNALLKRSTSSPAVLRQNSGKQETDIDGVRSSPRKKYSKTSNLDFPATKKENISSNRVSQRSRVTPSPSKQTRRLGESSSSLTYSSLKANDLDFGGSFSSLAHTSCIGLDEKSKELERRRRRYAQNRKINNELLANTYPIDFGGTVPAVAHASYCSRSKVNQQSQQNDDDEDDIVSLEDEIEDSFPTEMCSRKTPAKGTVSSRSNKKHQKRSKRHQRSPDIKKDFPEMTKLHSSVATFTDTTDTTAQESASFSSLSTTFSTTFQAMMQQTEQQQQQQQHEIDDSYYREHSLLRNTRNSGGSSGRRARR